MGAGTYTAIGSTAVRDNPAGNEGGEIGAFGAFFPDVRNKGDKPDVDAFIARIAARQHGVISVAQLRSLGVPATGTHRRVRANRLHPIHRGVYAVGHTRLSDEGRWMGAVLACGTGAMLSQLSAAELWGIRRRPRRRSEARERGGPDPVDITVPGTAGRRKRDGIVLHRSSTLTASDCTKRDGIPVTKPGRTLSDLRVLVSVAEFEAALREAEFLRLPIGDGFVTDGARTELEHRMLAVFRRHRLPQPEVNAAVDRYEVDFLWRDQRLVVEVDGWESHRTRSAFEEDRARDARLAALGYAVVRFTWLQLTGEAAQIAKTIRSLLNSKAA